MADTPSPWIARWAPAITPGGTVLDVACGSGRHVRHLADRGLRVTAVDRNREALARSDGIAELIEADLEGSTWPFPGRRFDAVVVTNYLWRPLLPTLVASVAEGGWLLYETFALGQQQFGRPSNPEFLLRPGELLACVPGLHVVAYEDGVLEHPPRRMQRLAAWRPTSSDALPPFLAVTSQALEFPPPQDTP